MTQLWCCQCDAVGSHPPPSICTSETPQPPDGVHFPGQDQAGWPQGKSKGRNQSIHFYCTCRVGSYWNCTHNSFSFLKVIQVSTFLHNGMCECLFVFVCVVQESVEDMGLYEDVSGGAAVQVTAWHTLIRMWLGSRTQLVCRPSSGGATPASTHWCSSHDCIIVWSHYCWHE